MDKHQNTIADADASVIGKIKIPSVLMEHMVEFSFILACVTAGSITLYFSLDFIGVFIGGIIGGIIAGLLPLIAQYLPALKNQSRNLLFVNLTIFAIFFSLSTGYFFHDATTEVRGHPSTTVLSRFLSSFRVLFLYTAWVSIQSVIIAVITRWLYKKWLKSEAKPPILLIFFIVLLFGFLPYPIMAGNKLTGLFWLPPIILAILLLFPFRSKTLSNSDSWDARFVPLMTGFSIASIHFLMSYFLFDGSTRICSNSRGAFLFPFFISPTWLISTLPFMSEWFEVLIDLKMDYFYLQVLISSAFYGYASSFLAKSQNRDQIIGAILISMPIFFGCFLIFGAFATGCGA